MTLITVFVSYHLLIVVTWINK